MHYLFVTRFGFVGGVIKLRVLLLSLPSLPRTIGIRSHCAVMCLVVVRNEFNFIQYILKGQHMARLSIIRYTQAHARAHKQTHTRTHAGAQTHTRTREGAQTHTHAHTRAHKHTHEGAQTNTHARTSTQTHTHTITGRI